jgi:septum formation protein
MTRAPELVLASGSPRRRELLAEAGYAFRVVAPEVEENEDTSLPVRRLTAENAALKADAVAHGLPDAVVLAADTLVLLGDRVLSKPADRNEAAAMLEALSGRTHEVFTAVALRHAGEAGTCDFTVTTRVRFKTLDAGERAAYHALVDPLDKAGGYAAQEHRELIVERIEGSFTNVVGLPMEEVAEVLRERFGIIPAPAAR